MSAFNYSYLEKYLHNQFLGDTEISHFLFNKIKKYELPKKQIRKVFISGLARSGTTALLNQLYISNEFASLKYSHMPFILNPTLSNIFSSISSKKNSEYKERIHKDGIKISVDSPECLDEPFWIKENQKYYSEALSSKRIYNEKTLYFYNNFLSKHALSQNKTRILIKNNNNHLRLPQLFNFFKNDLFIILFRDPISHSFSLSKSHETICNEQTKDPFILEYMNLIGHREFGLNQMPFNYNNKESQNETIFDSQEKSNYWIKSWINAYSWIYKFIRCNKPKNLIVVSYEELCNDNRKKIYEIFDRLKLKPIKNNILKNKNINIPDSHKIDKILLNHAYEIYESLTELD